MSIFRNPIRKQIKAEQEEALLRTRARIEAQRLKDHYSKSFLRRNAPWIPTVIILFFLSGAWIALQTQGGKDSLIYCKDAYPDPPEIGRPESLRHLLVWLRGDCPQPGVASAPTVTAPPSVAVAPPAATAVAPTPVPEAPSVASQVASGAGSVLFWLGKWATIVTALTIAARISWRQRWYFAGFPLQWCTRALQFFVVRADQFAKTLKHPTPNETLKRGVFQLIEQLRYLDEVVPVAERPKFLNTVEVQKKICLSYFRNWTKWLGTAADTDLFYRKLTKDILDRLVSVFPWDRHSTLTCAMHEELEPKVIEEIMDLLKNDNQHAVKVQEIYNSNITRISQKKLTHWERTVARDKKRISDGDVDPQEFVAKTPFKDFLNLQVPYIIDRRARYEHAVVVVPSGGGKSQTIEACLLQDLDQEDPPSILLIDMKDHIVPKVSRLLEFATRLRDRPIILRQSDRPSFALFDADSEQQLIEQTTFFLTALIKSEITGPQEGVLTGLVRLMWHISVSARERGVPGPNLETLRAALADLSQFHGEIQAIPDEKLKTYLLRDFKTSGSQTRDALGRRLDQIRVDPMLAAIFGGSKNCINFAEAFDQGKIILAVPSGAHGDVFGQFLLSQALGAAFARKHTPEEQLKDVHVYCDEADPYVTAETVPLFQKTRSFHIGCTFAFQDCDQMGKFANAILSNTAIKIAAGNSRQDAVLLKNSMGKTLVDFILQHQPPLRALGRPKVLKLVTWVRGERDGDRNKARTIQVRTGQMDSPDRPKMSPEAYDEFIKENYRWVHRHTPAVAGEPTDTYTPQPEAGRLGKRANRAVRRLLLKKDEGSADASPTP